jgi:hypothetical protein
MIPPHFAVAEVIPKSGWIVALFLDFISAKVDAENYNTDK